MKFKKIRTRMLVFILPVIVVAMGVISTVSGVSSRRSINQQIENHMNAELHSQSNNIQDLLDMIRATAESTAAVVEHTYKVTDLSTCEKMLSSVVETNESIRGSGLWFEPYVYDEKQEYVGPYVYRDGDKLATTYEYSNAEYDYFKQEYYTEAKENGKVHITDPYYDESSDSIMSSCSVPMYDDNNTYIGCVTVDMSLDMITDFISSIKVGKGGSIILTSGSGVYIAGVDGEKVKNAVQITKDDNASLVKAGNVILANENGTSEYVKNKDSYSLYYATVPELGWKLIIQMPNKEINEPVDKLLQKLVVICIIAIIVTVLVVLWQVSEIAKKLNAVKGFATVLAAGDFSVNTLNVTTEDELGSMGNAMNDMYKSNKEIISNIKDESNSIGESSRNLEKAATKLATEFSDIQESIAKINEAMMNSSAATEEVNASAEEVNANVNILTNQTMESKEMAVDIRNRAGEIKKSSQNSFDRAKALADQFEIKLEKSIENAKIVDSIGNMAEVISSVAEQINLLSLNASIEAARAGEAGKGFAVVAEEIGNLANETSKAVAEIQDTIEDVNLSFHALTDDATELLEFIEHTVTPDYNSFVDVANQYGKDSELLEDLSEKISDMTNNIKFIFNEVTEAIQSIAEASQDTSDISSDILSNVDDVRGIVDNVTEMSGEQERISNNLNTVVQKFKF